MKFSTAFKNKDGNETGGIMLIKNSADITNLFFYGEIVDEMWETEYTEESVCPKNVIDILSKIEENEPVNIYINSGGGSVFGGTSIYNILKRHKGEKNVIIDGIAASIASVIAMAGDSITMLKGSTLMVHKPMNVLFGMYNADEMRKKADTLDVLQESILTIYESRLKNKKDIEKVKEMVNKSTYLTAEQAAEIFEIQTDMSNSGVMNKIIKSYCIKDEKEKMLLGLM